LLSETRSPILHKTTWQIPVLLQPFCPCGSEIPTPHCCDRYLSGTVIAPTAEALMRSRYTAYSQGNVDYLIATLFPKSRQPNDRPTLLRSVQTTRWIGLRILKTQKGQVQDKRGTVEFVALYQPSPMNDLQNIGVTHQLHERSRFIKEREQWFYVDGEILPPIALSSF
jgi:SEC-C motif domain protein